MPEVKNNFELFLRSPRGLRLWSMIVAGATLFGVFLYYLTTLGPRPTSYDDGLDNPQMVDAKLVALSRDVTEAESKYLALTEAGAEPAAVLDALDRTIVRQRALVRANPGDNHQHAILARFESLRDTLLAKESGPRIAALEAEADEDHLQGRHEKAAELYRDALSRQRQINQSAAEMREKSFVRETRLALAIENAGAAPLKARVTEALNRAKAAAAEEMWLDALAAYEAALHTQVELNQSFPRSRLADGPLVDRLKEEIVSLEVAGEASEIVVLEKEGDAVMAAGNYEAAAALYRSSLDRQLALNRNQPRSRFNTTTRLDVLETKRQSALSALRMTEVEQLDRTAAGQLRRGQSAEAAAQIRKAATLLNRLYQEYPRSQRLDGAMKIKLAFLLQKEPDLQPMQEEVRSLLLPLPGAPQNFMTRVAIPQALYAKVMNTNPSRHAGPAQPVDSVTWPEAREFCRRLSWILGSSVRLPTEAEFRAALDGGLSGARAEWLEAAAAVTAEAPVAGGGPVEASAEPAPVKFTPTAKTTRAGNLGFRVVVEVPKE